MIRAVFVFGMIVLALLAGSWAAKADPVSVAVETVTKGTQVVRSVGDPGANCTAKASQSTRAPASENCSQQTLRFSADSLPSVPAKGSNIIWGGNANDGGSQLFSQEFLKAAKRAKQNGLQTFAYLEGPCGDTGGHDDGERSRCASAHRRFNAQFAPGTRDTAQERWKPFTLRQMKDSAKNQIDHCEVDNLENNITVPLVPFLKEVKALYDAGQIHCQLVLKNVNARALDELKRTFQTAADAKFISPFAIFETEGRNAKLAQTLNEKMAALKGKGAKTILSLDTNHYGASFTNEKIEICQ